MRPGYRSIKAPEFTPGGSRYVELSKLSALVQLYILHMTGTITTAGSTGVGAAFSDALWRLIDTITLRAGAVDQIRIAGQTMRIYEKFFMAAPYIQDHPTTVVNGTEAVEMFFPLPLYMPHSTSPLRFLFPAASATDPVLDIRWGQLADMYNASVDGTRAFNDSEVIELIERFIDGPGNPLHYWPLMINFTSIPVEATETNREVTLDFLPTTRGGLHAELRALIIETQSGGAGGSKYAYADDVLDNISFKIGNNTIAERLDFKTGQQENVRNYNLAARETGVLVLDVADESRDTGPHGALWELTHKPVLRGDFTKGAGQTRVRVTAVYTRRPW